MWLEQRECCTLVAGRVFQNPSHDPAHHARNQQSENLAVTPAALLPRFFEQVDSVAMIRHALEVFNAAVNHLNPGQTPVIPLDQPLFAIAKHGDSVDLTRELQRREVHIEMAALKMTGSWLQGIGWTKALVQEQQTLS